MECCSLPHSFLPLLSPTCPTPSSPSLLLHHISYTTPLQHFPFIPLPHPPLLPFLFSNHPLPIHFPFSPILFSLYIPSLHSSFTFIICIIFYLSLPHPLNPSSFAPSLPSIILLLLIIHPLCPISPLAYLYCPSPPPLPFTPTPTTTILKISSPEMSSVLEHGIRSAPLLPPLLSPTHPTPSSPSSPSFPLIFPPLLLTST